MTMLRTMQDTTTTLAPDDVIARAKAFFSSRLSLYAAYVDKEGPGFVSLRGQGGEEVVVAAQAGDGGTRVTASSYLFDAQVARFLTTINPELG
jgi:hypothetical protein